MEVEKKKVKLFCSRCGKKRSTDNFSFIPSVGRYHNYCKDCDRAQKKEWYIKNKEKLDQIRKDWQANNMGKHREHVKKYSQSEKCKIVRKRYLERKKLLTKKTIET
jgi:hypothetical protein